MILFSLLLYFFLIPGEQALSSPQVSKNLLGNLSEKERKSSAPQRLSYRTSFGSCPSRIAGNLTLELMKTFEVNQSLRDLKQQIVKQKLFAKHYLSQYEINYDPFKKFLFLKFDCPKPLVRVQVYKDKGIDSYKAVLVENGQLFDDTYINLLISEGKIKSSLGSFAIPVSLLEKGYGKKVAKLLNSLEKKFFQKISELVIKEDNSMVMILSIKNRPTSVFLGSDEWEDKLKKLMRITNYMEKNKKIPAVINLTNQKKVVVKFSE